MKKLLTYLLIVILVIGGLEAVAISIDKGEYKTTSYLLDDELDQSQTEFETGVPIGNYQIQNKPRLNWTVAQSFKPIKEIQTRIQLLLSRNSTSQTIYPFVVCIRKYLTSENIGMLSIEPEKIPEFPDFLWIEFDFEDMLMTIPHNYFIVCYTTNETDNCYLWGGKGNNSYPNGQIYLSIDDGETWDDGPPWDAADMCFKTYGRDNNRPDLPEIIGKINGNIQTSYEYTISSIDPDGDNIAYYLILWDDDTHTNKTGPFASGESVTASHKWKKQGTYTILVRATDVFGKHSYWGELEVTMPKNKATYNIGLFRFLERFRILQIFI